MTAVADRPIADKVKNALNQSFDSVTELDGGQWNCSLGRSSSSAVIARSEEGWLSLWLSPARSADSLFPVEPGRLWKVLEANRKLSGGAKYVLGWDYQPGLRADIPLDGDSDLNSRVAEAHIGFLQAAGQPSPGSAVSRTVSRLKRLVRQSGETEEDLTVWCNDAGWPSVRRSAGKLAVDLEVPGDLYQAVVERQKEGGIRAAVEFDPGVELAEPCRRALGLLLLRACSCFRMVRASVEKRSGQTLTVLEVSLGASCAPAELNHALTSLSVASRLCGREIRALHDEDTANRYLVAELESK